MVNDLTGKRYGRLVVESRNGSTRRGQSIWTCLCDCGRFVDVRVDHLTSGATTSCGCYMREKAKNVVTTHGLTQSRLYGIWRNMKTRCENENNKNHSHYGGRGITVCEEWRESFEAFRDWARANGYRDDLTIDREDTNGPYSPDNCRWATMVEQQNNRRNNRCLEYNGESKTIAQWARDTGIRENTIRSRLKYGWSIQRTLTEPVNTKFSH